MERYGIYLADFDPRSKESIGTVHYGVGLARALPELLRDDEQLVVYAPPDVAQMLPPHERLRVENVPRSTRVAGRVRTEQHDSVRVARRDGLAVLHFLKGMVPARRAPGTAYVVTVHDDIPLQYLRGRFGRRGPIGKNAYVTSQILWALWRADAVITVSEAAADALSSYCRRRPVAVGEGLTVPDDPTVPLTRRDPRVLVFASGLAHKQTAPLLHALARSKVVADAGWHVGLVGPTRPPGTADLHLEDLGTPSSDELHRLIENSRVVGFHSTYEGLGLPPLEAWALGTPAVRPGLPSLDEVLDGVPGRMASLDRCALDAALAEVRDLDDRRVAEVRARVRARFDWSEVAARVLEQYRRAQSRCVAR